MLYITSNSHAHVLNVPSRLVVFWG